MTQASSESARITDLADLSLEQKLPLLNAALLVVVLGAALLLTYREVTRSAFRAASERLQRATTELASSVDASTAERLRIQREVTVNPSLRLAFAGMPIDTASLRAALDRLVLPADSGLATELWTAAGRRIATWGHDVAPDRAGVRPQLVAARADSVRYGPLYAAAGHVYFWVVIPVRDLAAPARLHGWIVRQRRVATSPRAETQIRGLVGADVDVYFRNDTGAFWSTIVGVPTGPSLRASTTYGVPIAERDHGNHSVRVLTTDARLRGTPWAIVLEQPEGTAVAGARGTLSRLGLVAVLLLLAGLAGSWLLSRRVARPLVALAAAAERVAHGEYARIDAGDDETGTARRTPIRPRRDEVRRLATSFNRMVDEIAASRAELEQQVGEAQTMAEELEETNAQLAEAARDAHEARRGAEKANTVKDQFLAQMSHELRTPLNAIVGYTQLVEMGIAGPVTEQQRDYLHRLGASGKHLMVLVDDVLDLAKTDANQMSVAREQSVLAPVIAAALAVVVPQASHKLVRLVDLAAGRESIPYVGDDQRVRQILVNLLSNALKFTPPGGTVEVSCGLDQRVPVDIRSTDAGPWAWIRVKDTGIGIPFDRQTSVFEPFVQAEAGFTRSTTGSGLGLTISRRLARLMGGDITLESTPRAGSIFTLWLPAPRDAVRHADVVERADRGRRAQPS